MSNKNSNNIKVFARFRPLNDMEKSKKSDVPIKFSDTSSVKIEKNNLSFTLDQIFSMESTQEEVYETAAESIVTQIMQGYNGTIFAYGQTSSGKTFTMEGPSLTESKSMGIIPRSIDTIFSLILQVNEQITFTLKLSMLEIYNETLNDLLDLSRTQLKIRENVTSGVYVAGLSEYYIKSPQEGLDLIQTGSHNRTTASTAMNKQSSRSHSIVVLNLTQKNQVTTSSKYGTLYLVDLAGSEKVDKTQATGQRLEEAKKINLSLLTLNRVISALTEGSKSHIPYLDSKLTKLLQESLGGNSKTSLICNCSPANFNIDETISTLRFAASAKKITNKAKVNIDEGTQQYKVMCAKLQKEVESLKELVIKLEKSPDEGIEILKKELAEAQKLIIQRDGELQQLNQEYSNLDEKTNYLNTLANQYKAKIAPLEDQMDNIRSENEKYINDLRNENAELLNKNVMLMEDAETYKLKFNQKVTSSTINNTTVDKLKDEIEQQRSANQALRNKILELSSGHITDDGFRREVNKIMEENKSELEKVINEKKQLQQDINNLDTNYVSEINKYQQQISELKTNMSVKQQTMNTSPQLPQYYYPTQYVCGNGFQPYNFKQSRYDQYMTSGTEQPSNSNTINPNQMKKDPSVLNKLKNFFYKNDEPEIQKDMIFDDYKSWNKLVINHFQNLSKYFAQLDTNLTDFTKITGQILREFDLYFYSKSEGYDSSIISKYTQFNSDLTNTLFSVLQGSIGALRNNLDTKLTYLLDLQELGGNKEKLSKELDQVTEKIKKLNGPKYNEKVSEKTKIENELRVIHSRYYESANFYKKYKNLLLTYEFNLFRVSIYEFYLQLSIGYQNYKVEPSLEYDFIAPYRRSSVKTKLPYPESTTDQVRRSTINSMYQSTIGMPVHAYPMAYSYVAANSFNKTIYGEQKYTTRKKLDNSPFYAIASTDCIGDLSQNILPFKKDDVILVTDDLDDNYYFGNTGGMTGNILKKYVRPFSIES